MLDALRAALDTAPLVAQEGGPIMSVKVVTFVALMVPLKPTPVKCCTPGIHVEVTYARAHTDAIATARCPCLNDARVAASLAEVTVSPSP
jgi:hypothetical protein